MNYLFSYIKVVLHILVLLIIFIACGGGSGDDSTIRDSEDNNSNTSSGNNINDGLLGRIYVNEKNEGMMINLHTGTVERVPNVIWEETDDYSNLAKYSALPSIDGSEFVLTAKDCELHSSQPIIYRRRDCISIIDINGNSIGRGTIYEGLDSGGKLSFDGSYIAFMYANEPEYSSPAAQLHIVDRNFQSISSTLIKHSSTDNHHYLWRGFDWTRNGQIVYGYDKSIYITSVYGTDGSQIYTIPTADINDDHFISQPKVSPDGTKIAFRYITDSNHLIKQGNVWVMNIDGTDLHRLVYTPNYEAEDGSTITAYQVYNDHAWSPDGKNIMVMEGGTSGDLVSGPDGASDELYVIPSDSRDVPLNNNGEHGIIHIRTYFESPSELTYRFEPYTGTISWVP